MLVQRLFSLKWNLRYRMKEIITVLNIYLNLFKHSFKVLFVITLLESAAMKMHIIGNK